MIGLEHLTGPEEVKVELTRICSLKCVHCSASAGGGVCLSLAPQVALGVVRDSAELGVRTLVLTGGEPLSYPYLVSVASEAKRVSLQVLLYTTGIVGLRVAPALELLEALARIVDGFVCCLHGATAEVHDSITGVRGSFGATLEALRYLKSRNQRVIIHHVPLLPNMDELLPLCGLITEIGFSSLKLLRFVPQGRGEENCDMLELGAIGIRRLGEQLVVAREKFPRIAVDLGAPYSLLDGSRAVPCGAGYRTLSISADLTCSPCDGFKAVHGSVFSAPLGASSLSEFWRDSPMLAAIRTARQESLQAGCEGCLSQRFLACGSLDPLGKDPLLAMTAERTCEATVAL